MCTRLCPRCGRVKPVDEFHRWSQRDGRQVYCKSCRAAYDAAYHQRTWGEEKLARKRSCRQGFAR